MEISLIYDQWSWREKVARDVCSVMYINMTCTQNAYNAYNLLCTWSRYSHIKTALYLLISYGWMHYLHMHYATMQLTVEKCKWKKSLKTQVKMRIRWWAHLNECKRAARTRAHIHNLAYFSNTLATIVQLDNGNEAHLFIAFIFPSHNAQLFTHFSHPFTRMKMCSACPCSFYLKMTNLGTVTA